MCAITPWLNRRNAAFLFEYVFMKPNQKDRLRPIGNEPAHTLVQYSPSDTPLCYFANSFFLTALIYWDIS